MKKIRYILDGISVSPDSGEQDILAKAEARLRRVGIPSQSCKLNVYRKSVDARHKNDIRIVCSVSADPCDADKYISEYERLGARAVLCGELDIKKGSIPQKNRPLVVGMGPAGMFCALILAEQGYRPIIIDRGDCVDDRVAAVDGFYKTGILDPESNIQFGAGGAGTFSDGKLVTRINDPLCSLVLERFHELGAPDDILTKAKPHVGTDVLRGVVNRILEKIQALGGEVIYRCRLNGINERTEGIEAVTNKGSFLCSALVLALGHSARDTYEMLLGAGFEMMPKPLSVGVRIEHRREDIERAMYGSLAGHPALGSAEYALSDTKGKRGVYTFCMCPGGEVVAAASEEGGVVVNGMSSYARDGQNSNCAVAVSVDCDDIEPVRGSLVLGAIEFQRSIERAAFRAGGGNYNVPVQTVGDFLSDKHGSFPTRVLPTYMGGDRYKLSDMRDVLPAFVTESLKYGLYSFDKKISGFAAEYAMLSGAETRTSSPLRILRGADMVANGRKNIYPCGEGAGYAGGITSAAVDGIRVALAIMEKNSPCQSL